MGEGDYHKEIIKESQGILNIDYTKKTDHSQI